MNFSLTNWMIMRLYPGVEWELLHYPRPEDFESEEDFEREFRATMILNDATRAGWPTQQDFDRDALLKFGLPFLIVAGIIIEIVVVTLFG